MSEETDRVLTLAKRVADQAESLVKDLGHSLGINLEITPLIIPKAFDQWDLDELCKEHGLYEIRYNARSRKFFGVRLIEDQPDSFPPMG